MQKIYFEKWVDLEHQLNELLSLSVDESINYKIENVGVRAIGSLIVKGEYNENKKFEENIEMDVLATFDKIVDQRDFNIKVEDFDYYIKDGNIQIKIEVGIHGVVDGEDRYVKDENFMAKDDPLEEIENLIRDEPQSVEAVREQVAEKESEPIVMKKPETIKKVQPVYQEKVAEPSAMTIPEVKTSEVIMEGEAIVAKEVAVAEEISEQLEEKVYPNKSRPIFQDTGDSVGTYYLYIVKENEGYSDVAARYSIDENVIRDYNQDKELEPGCVLIIPYVCQ